MAKQPNPNDLVTRTEFEEGMQMVKTSFDHATDHTNEVRNELKEEIQQIRDMLETVLAIVQSLDEDRKERRAMTDIPERVDHLEEDVFKIKAKVFSEDR